MILASFFGPFSWRTDLSLKCVPKNWIYQYSAEAFLVQSLFCRLYLGWSCRMSYSCAAVLASMKLTVRSLSSLRTALWPVVSSPGLWNWLCLGCEQLNAAHLRLVPELAQAILPCGMHSATVSTLAVFLLPWPEGLGLYLCSWLNTYVQTMLI